MNIDPLPQRTPYEVSPRRYSVSHQMATTAFELPNFRVMQTLGVVRGIVVRSRNVFATLGATFQQLAGGSILIGQMGRKIENRLKAILFTQEYNILRCQL